MTYWSPQLVKASHKRSQIVWHDNLNAVCSDDISSHLFCMIKASSYKSIPLKNCNFLKSYFLTTYWTMFKIHPQIIIKIKENYTFFSWAWNPSWIPQINSLRLKLNGRRWLENPKCLITVLIGLGLKWSGMWRTLNRSGLASPSNSSTLLICFCVWVLCTAGLITVWISFGKTLFGARWLPQAWVVWSLNPLLINVNGNLFDFLVIWT